jgi:uncharacterized membrane protein
VPELRETAVAPGDVPGPHEGPTAPAGDETPPTPAREPESHESSRELDRIIFFSDAVFAIAITLLVLDLKVPAIPARQVAAHLGPALRGLGPLYLSYAISFLVIGSFWAAHHRIYRHITGYDGTLIALNTLLLLCIAFLPFPSAVLGQYGDTPLAPMLYAAVLATVSFLLLLIWAYACWGWRLVAASIDPRLVRAHAIRAAVTVLIFLLSIPLALVNTTLTELCWVLIFFLPRLLTRLRV